ncbi:SulP family inorganic anion transporter [Leptonema illini]|uniref:Sulfate transporter n=1 Tax=Leptonema illini DSM 21528 TaxID=929563 RepID=H2CIM5_9LEPT|nr:sulfate permease [Leptonema illini]EHQ07041.1 sulfate transporter [Leptonema illini DSM 21528]
MFTPELLRSLRTYSMRRFASDISAGLIVGIVALPLAIAFAIASGVSPERGLITAVVAGFLISAFGGSRVQIGGPTGAFVVIVYGIVQEFGLSGLLVATFLAGLMLLMMGFARLGSVIRYIPHPVTVGFTSGIAVIIFSSQMRDFLGLPVVSLPADFIGQWQVYWQQAGAIDPVSLVMALLCTITMAVWPRITHRIPGSIVVILAATLITVQFDLPVDTIGSRFGEIPSHIPAPAFFEIDLGTVRSLLPAAFAIAMLGAIESLLSAVVADGMTGSRHNPDAELISQGIANIASPLFGGIPATGAIARTATNIRNGATSPVAGIVHAATLLAIMLLFGSYVKHIPMPVLASILVIVAYNMSEWRTFLGILKSPRSDVIVLLATFFLTVVFDLVLAIEVGLVLAVLLFIRRMSQVSQVRVLSQDSVSDDDHENTDDPMDIRHKSVPARTEVYEINGPFFFGTANLFASAARIAADPPLVRIIRMRRVPAIDATGIHMLEKFIHDSGRDGIHVLLSGVHKQPLFALEKAGLLAQVGEENIAENIDVALRRAGDVVKQAISEESAS